MNSQKIATVKAMLLGSSLVTIWFVLQVLLNIAFMLQGDAHHEGVRWVELEKAYASPAFAAYLALSAGHYFLRDFRWRIVVAVFVLTIVAFDIWSIAYTTESLTTSNRGSELNGTLLEIVGGTLCAFVATGIFYLQHIKHEE